MTIMDISDIRNNTSLVSNVRSSQVSIDIAVLV